MGQAAFSRRDYAPSGVSYTSALSLQLQRLPQGISRVSVDPTLALDLVGSELEEPHPGRLHGQMRSVFEVS